MLLRWTLRTLALWTIALVALNLASIHRDDLVTFVRFAFDRAPPAAGEGAVADRGRTGVDEIGRDHPAACATAVGGAAITA